MILKYVVLLRKYFYGGSLTSRAYLNTFATFLNYISRILVGLITNPIIVGIVGIHLYGVWQFLTRLSGYTTFVGGRPSVTLRWKIAHLQASTDYSEKRRVLGSAILVWLLSTPLLIIIGGIIAWFTPLWLKTSPENYLIVRLTAVLLLVGNMMIGLTELPQYILQGENKAYKRMGLSSIIALSGGGLTILMMYLKTGILGLGAVYLFMILVEGWLYLKVAQINIQWIGVDRPSIQEIKSYFSLNWWYLGWSIVYQLLLSSDLILLGLITSPEQVGIYSLSKYVPEVTTSLIIMILAGILPGMGRFLGINELNKFTGLRNELYSIVWIIGLSIISVSTIWNRSFVTLWVGGDKFVSVLPSILINLKVFQFILLITDAAILDLTLDIKGKVILAAVSLFISISSSIFFMKVLDWGLTGLCVAFILGQSILTIGYPKMVLRYLRINVSRRWIQLIRPAGITAIILAISIFLGTRIMVNDWISLIMLCTITFLLVLTSTYYFGLPILMRKQLLVRLPFQSLSK